MEFAKDIGFKTTAQLSNPPEGTAILSTKAITEMYEITLTELPKSKKPP